jgi:hypothetical protein
MNLPGQTSPRLRRVDDTAIEHVLPQRPLRRVLSFTNRTIDDVVNDAIAKHQVLGYFKLHKWIDRGIAIRELERQWNSV